MSWGNCRYRLCKCDADAAECFAESPYHREYNHYPQEKCTKGEHAKPKKADKPEETENPEKPEQTEENINSDEIEKVEKPEETAN